VVEEVDVSSAGRLVRIVLLGPPGAGKGTHGKFIESRFHLPQVSTGDILRQAAHDQTPLGQEALGYMSKGALVPDDLMLDLVRERLARADCEAGFVLDGFPRTITQAEGLDQLLSRMGSRLDAVILIRVVPDSIIERLCGRRTCRRCNSLYHVNFVPPVKDGICDRCGGELYQREDDRKDMVSARLDVYEKQTAPLIDYYRGRGILSEIDGCGSVAAVRDRILRALELTLDDLA
jgi:adenylate kinase